MYVFNFGAALSSVVRFVNQPTAAGWLRSTFFDSFSDARSLRYYFFCPTECQANILYSHSWSTADNALYIITFIVMLGSAAIFPFVLTVVWRSAREYDIFPFKFSLAFGWHWSKHRRVQCELSASDKLNGKSTSTNKHSFQFVSVFVRRNFYLLLTDPFAVSSCIVTFGSCATQLIGVREWKWKRKCDHTGYSTLW